jgi:hypothetical protein
MNDATAIAKQVESNPKQREINGRTGRKFYQLLIKGSLLIFNPLCATTRIYRLLSLVSLMCHGRDVEVSFLEGMCITSNYYCLLAHAEQVVII